MPTRRERIEAMLIDEPRYTFLRYSLALELEKEGDHERSLAGLRDLMADSPPNVPACFRAGQQLAQPGRIAEPASTPLRANTPKIPQTTAKSQKLERSIRLSRCSLATAP